MRQIKELEERLQPGYINPLLRTLACLRRIGTDVYLETPKEGSAWAVLRGMRDGLVEAVTEGQPKGTTKLVYDSEDRAIEVQGAVQARLGVGPKDNPLGIDPDLLDR